jgi:hypothetical protein
LPAYKRQHFLPAVYLKEFSADRRRLDRSSRLWRFDGKVSRLVSVARQCAKDYFYSRERAAASEKMFQGMEGLYADCLRKIKTRQSPSTPEYFGLILMMFDLHLRNAAYLNLTGKDNLHAYYLRLRALRHKILLESDGTEPSDAEVWEHLRSYWRVRVLDSSIGSEFITSDNPSIWMQFRGGQPRLEMMILPVTPVHIAIAYDRRRLDVVGERTTHADEGGLNKLQCRSAMTCIYISSSLSAEQESCASDVFMERGPHLALTSDQQWDARLFRTGGDKRFSFTRDAPPVL